MTELFAGEPQGKNPQEAFQFFFKSEKYRERISQMSLQGSTSLVLDFDDILVVDGHVAEGLLSSTEEFLKHGGNAAFDQLQIQDPEYAEQIRRQGVTIRVRGLPFSTPLRSITSEQIGKLVKLEGVVIRATNIRPLVVNAVFRCNRCDEIIPVPQTGSFMIFPFRCSNSVCRNTRSFEFVQEESAFVDSQEIRIQEYPEELPPGQTPRAIDIHLVGKEMVDVSRPGDRVIVGGIVRAEAKSYPRTGKLRAFNLYIDANLVETTGKAFETLSISPEEEQQIIKMAKDPKIHQKIINSIAPSVYGYEYIKEAIMYLLFGGTPKNLSDITIRGELNILLVGDPGTAKSQLLRYIPRIAPRGLYTSGRGTTAAGLTAAVLPNPTGGMTLEAGALVLADKGIACIDEMDKMRTEDRVAIHEAMEQHTISIAKGGIVATLNARAAILAAANPSLGRYDAYRTVAENISLPVTILSRFDLIFVIRDVPERDHDSKMSEHILRLHMEKRSPYETPMSSDLLRKYVSYAKNYTPVLSAEALRNLRDFYMKMRSTSEAEGSPLAITARQLESLVRISEARARAALRDKILPEDSEAAIAIMKKSLEEAGIDVSSHKIDIDIIMTGKPKSLQDRLRVILNVLVDLEKETGTVKRTDLLEKLALEFEIQKFEAERLIGQLIKEGTVYEPRNGFLKKT